MPVVNLKLDIELSNILAEWYASLGVPETALDDLLDAGGNPSIPVVDQVIPLDILLSKYYGKNIRQGNTFKVKGVSTALRAKNSEYDVGLATTSRFGYCPTTKHSRKAWNNAFRLWQRQKRMKATTGSLVRFDDFEMALQESYVNSRTSNLYQGGLIDTDPDNCIIYGDSHEGGVIAGTSQFALEDHYNSLNPVAQPSAQAWNNLVVKDPKYQDKFPAMKFFESTATHSSVPAFESEGVDVDTIIGGLGGTTSFLHLGGAISDSDLHTFEEAHPVMCGQLRLQTWMIPDDTIHQLEDNAYLYVTLYIESWKSLVYKPRRTYRSRKGRGYSSRFRRMSGKGRRRRYRYGRR